MSKKHKHCFLILFNLVNNINFGSIVHFISQFLSSLMFEITMYLCVSCFKVLRNCLVVCYHDGYHRPSSRHSMLDCVKNQQSKSKYLAFSNFNQKKTKKTHLLPSFGFVYFCVDLIPWVCCVLLCCFCFWGTSLDFVTKYEPISSDCETTPPMAPLPSLFLSSSGHVAD